MSRLKDEIVINWEGESWGLGGRLDILSWAFFYIFKRRFIGVGSVRGEKIGWFIYCLEVVSIWVVFKFLGIKWKIYIINMEVVIYFGKLVDGWELSFGFSDVELDISDINESSF